MSFAREILETFRIDTIPTLDVAASGALELIAHNELPRIPIDRFRSPIVVGSGNAFATGNILFEHVHSAHVVTETEAIPFITGGAGDGVVVVSASGSKDSVAVVAAARTADLPVMLITNTKDSPAAAHLHADDVCVLPKNREPYTYNTSTYLSMIASVRPFDAHATQEHIAAHIDTALPQSLSQYQAVTVILPDTYHHLVPMLRVKFDELFGPMLNGRVFSETELRHAKTLVPSPKEYFISIGVVNTEYGEPGTRTHIPLPDGCGYGAALAISYYVIGMIQRQLPPYFADNVVSYTESISHAFGHRISPIVE